MMTIERFLNHIYYSFAGIDRFFSYHPDDLREGNNMENIASKLMSISIAGYLAAILYFLIILPLRLIGVYSEIITVMLILFVVLIGLSFILPKFFNPTIYKKYFKEFREDRSYKIGMWNTISAVFFFAGAYLFIYVVSQGLTPWGDLEAGIGGTGF